MNSHINRRDLFRIGTGAAIAAPAMLANGEAPKFFTPAEFTMVDELSEIIIPADEHSPGARAAKVAAYIDARLAEAFAQEQRDDWRAGLKLVDDLSKKTNDKPFMDSTPAQRVAVLEIMSQNEREPKKPDEIFFKTLKTFVARAYYTSKIGIHDEMEYKGNVMLKEFVGYEVK